MKNLLKKLSRDERGVSALEYAILAAVVIGVVISALTVFEGTLTDAFTTVSEELKANLPSSGQGGNPGGGN